MRALGAMTDEDVAPLHAAAAKGRAEFAMELMRAVSESPRLAGIMTVLLYETLGPTLGAGNENAASVWGIAHNFARRYPDSLHRAGVAGEGPALGEALFEAIMKNRSGVVMSVDPYEETWRRIHGEKINLTIAELMPELRALRDEHPVRDADFPSVLSAGQRRSSTANTIIRDPNWRPGSGGRALDESGGRLRTGRRERRPRSHYDQTCERRERGRADRHDDAGACRAAERYRAVVSGPRRPGISAWRDTNELTVTEDRDWFAGTPFHKHVPARIQAVE